MSVSGVAFVHPTAEVSPDAQLSMGVKIWNHAQIREFASVGENSIISKNVYVDCNTRIGRNCKIQNNCSLYQTITMEDGVFVGPHVIFTNDKVPRAINPDGTQKNAADWVAGTTLVEYGASIGAGSIILPGSRIGRFAMIGSGAVVTRSVPPFALVVGNPARIIGWVNEAGDRVSCPPES